MGGEGEEEKVGGERERREVRDHRPKPPAGTHAAEKRSQRDHVKQIHRLKTAEAIIVI